MLKDKLQQASDRGEIPNTWTNGFDLQDPDSMGTISWDSTSRTVSLAPASGQDNFVCWCNGKRFSFTSTLSCQVPNTTDLYYVYIDNDGEMQYVAEASSTSALFHEYSVVALIRWNATAGTGGCGEERHGIRMSGTTHMSKHMTTGALYETGMNVLGLVHGNATYTSTSSGYFWDEDIRHSVASQSTHKFFYRLGAAGEWTTTDADNKIGHNGGSGDYKWNEWDGSAWKLSAATSDTDYFMTIFAAVPTLNGGQIVKFIGHEAYATRAQARNAIETEVNNLKLEGLPSPEIVFLFAAIVRRNGKLQKLADGSTYFDLRQVKGGAGGSSNTEMYGNDVPLDVTNFTGCLGASDTDVQTAIESLMTAINP